MVTSLLVYGTLLTFPLAIKELPGQEERMAAMRCSREESAKLTSELRTKTALRSCLPPATKYDLIPGQRVRVYLECSKRWEGPLRIERISGKPVWITDDQRRKQFCIAKVIPDPSDSADQELARLINGFTQFESGSIPGILLT